MLDCKCIIRKKKILNAIVSTVMTAAIIITSTAAVCFIPAQTVFAADNSGIADYERTGTSYAGSAQNPAYKVYSYAYDAIERINTMIDDANKQNSEYIGELLDELSELQKQADSVSGADKKLKDAGNVFFNLIYGSIDSYCGIIVFLEDFIDYRNTLFARPQLNASVYNDFAVWYKELKTEYDNVDSCPPCMTKEWKRFGDALDLNLNIANKLYYANKYNDNLRYITALEMSNRYDVILDERLSFFSNCLIGEAELCDLQLDTAILLAEEIYEYSQMSAAERGEYEFEYLGVNDIVLDYESVDIIYPSLYNTYDAFLIVNTGCISGSKRILVEAEIPGFTQTYKEIITVDSAFQKIYIKPPALTGSLNLSSAKNAQIKVTITEVGGNLLDAKSFPVKLKSKYDFEWDSDKYGVSTRDNILCFLTPESTAITQLKRKAIDEISAMTGGSMEALIGYQNNAWNNYYVGTYIQVAGIMRAMYESGVRYNMDTFSLSGSNQHILFPDDVLSQRGGLCIETSLVVASALQSAGMHVFLLFPPGHAQVAVEVNRGSGTYFLIETTALTAEWNNRQNFVADAELLLDNKRPQNGPIKYYSKEEWTKTISADGYYVIDCDDAGVLGLTAFSN